ncbi:MAG: glycosyltransferase family 4 protein [Myxococcota bacterium]
MILYVRSERGAHSRRPSRKLVSIHQTWRDMGFEVELISGEDVYGAITDESASNERAAPIQFRSNPGLTGIQAPLVHSVSEYRDIRHDRLLKDLMLKQLAGRKPQLIWHRASRLHLAPLLVARELGVPYALEWIDRLISYNFSLFRHKAVAADDRRMQEALRVIVVSQRWKQEVVDEYGIGPERVIVSHNAVDADQFTRDPEAGARIRQQIGIPSDALVMGFVGKYNWHHNAHLMPQAAAMLRKETDAPIYWLLVGDGPHRAHMEAVTNELGVDDIVVRQGSVPHDEVPAWMSAMDAGVVPVSGGEIICPIKVPEYMAAGLCPVVADGAANREVVETGRTGMLFRSGDARSMADAVRELSDTPGLVGRLGSAAQAEAAVRFSWRATWGQALLDVLAEIEEGNTRPAGPERN